MNNYKDYFKHPLDEKVYEDNDGENFYTYEEVINLAKGNVQYANLLIERVNGQTIETLIQDDLIEGEILYYKQQYLLTHGEDIEIINTENL